LDEVARILAVGLLRLRAKPVRAGAKREFSPDNYLGCPAETRLPVTVDRRKE